VGNYCYVAVCSAALGASAPTERERGGGRGHVVAAARLQLVYWRSVPRHVAPFRLFSVKPDRHSSAHNINQHEVEKVDLRAWILLTFR